MSGPFRTRAGGRIDRDRVIAFRFDGRTLAGCQGDTLASALLANGVHLVGRSFKYHRPRGILAAGAEEPSALVEVRRDDERATPNLRATQVELYEGLEARSQNRWPSLAFDAAAVNDLLSPFLPAGFYYKTFMWPPRAWRALYEPLIRAAAGLGRAPARPDPDRYAQRYAHCDVLVVGCGPAGLAAAAAAAASGARVILCDEQAELGGSLLGTPAALIEGRPGWRWLAETLAALARNERVRLLPRTTAFGYFPHNLVALNERITDHLAHPRPPLPRERQWQVRAREVVLATGAIERPLVFPGNDRPGIMLAESARIYLARYGVIAGTRAVVAAGCDEAYRAALELHAAGVEIALIADARARAEGLHLEAARRAGLPIELATRVTGTSGRLRVRAVRVASGGEGASGGRVRSVRCDLVLMSGGFTPSVHLFSQSRGKLAWNEANRCFLPAEPAERVRCAGACRGIFDLVAALADGAAAGANAAERIGLAGEAPERAPPPLPSSAALDAVAGALVEPGDAGGAKAFVDWQNDVTVKDLALAAREGFRSIEHVKRYTTTGMATDQGKTSNLNALGIVARALQHEIPAIGLTTFRMPYTPVSFGSFAGVARQALFDPVRTTPIHTWAERHGATFEDVGAWKRARYFAHPGEDMHAAVARECLAVRERCGLFDASTLGKIEVAGPDAAVFLDRLYVNALAKLPVGRCRYGLLLRDDGFIFDDGVIARLAADRFHVTTTTGGAARVLALMEDYAQTEWPDLKVWLTSTTEQWAVIAVQGPRARQVLAGLVEDIDLSAPALPHMSAALARFCGIPALVCRVSFTGELGFEVNVPADFGLAAWEAVHQAGEAHGISAYGTEAMHVLRAEKGYIIVGQDADGTVTPDDAGLAWAIGKDKVDFLGKRSLRRAAMADANRKQLVGLLTVEPERVLAEGAQLIERASPPPLPTLGHVTSAYASAVLRRSIALGLVAGGRRRVGERLLAQTRDGAVPVEVTTPIFYDREGARLHA